LSMGEFCHAYFQRTSLATDNFQCVFYSQKNPQITFKVTFVANGYISALITPGQPATDNFQHLVRLIQRAKSTEVTF
jgi:hypothetical protein